MAKGYPYGRPTKYNKKYCEMLIEHNRQGLSFDTFGATIGVHRDTLYEWVKIHKDFSDAKKLGADLRNLLVERTIVEETLNDNPNKTRRNPALLIYWTKNTLGWSDNVKVEDTAPNKTLTLKYKLDD